MPRDTRRRTQREEVELQSQRPVRIDSQRRFYTARGNDQAVRDARALADAFKAGSQLAGNLFDKANREGAQRAAEDVAQGRDRNPEDDNAGYMNAWDQLEAERDLNLAKEELPELLRGADWENKSEDEVRQLIDAHLSENFKGAEGVYAQTLAPGLLALEEELVAQHRDMQLESVRQDQRSTIYANLLSRYKENGEVDYAYAAEQTNTFFDGANKKVAYWEMIADMAVENGDPSILDNVPERFPSGDPTGVNDPKMQKQIRAWRREALGMQAAQAKAAQEAVEAEQDAAIFNAQLAVVNAVHSGRDGNRELNLLASLPGVEFSDISTARNFASSYRDDDNEVQASLPVVASLWKKIHGFSGTNPKQLQDEIWTSLAEGHLGNGPQAVDTYNDMQDKLRSVANQGEGDQSKAITTWRQSINKQYAADKGGVVGIDPIILRINLAAHNFYTAQLDSGQDPESAFYETTQRFDPILAAAPTLNEDEIDVESRRTQSDFEASQVVTDGALKAVGSGEREFVDVFGGVNPAVIERRVDEAHSAGNLTDDEATRILTNVYY